MVGSAVFLEKECSGKPFFGNIVVKFAKNDHPNLKAERK